MSAMIDIQKLRKEFGPFVAVDDVSFSVGRGEVLGFLGPNGAGKSTTMKMITGYLSPTAGTAVVCGHDVLKEPMKVKERIGYLPEGAPAYPDMTPEKFLRFCAEARGFKGSEISKRVGDAVEKVALESHLYQPIETLSKGFKRRVGLAQAILHDPEVLIMDEPTDGLDPNQKHEVRLLIREMAAEKAIILSTHILEEVDAVCTRATIIAAGKVIADGTPESLQQRAGGHNAVVIRLREGTSADPNALEKISSVRKVESITDRNGRTCFRVIPKNGASIADQVTASTRELKWEIDELHVEQGRLDEVFRDLTYKASKEAGRES